MEIDPKVINRFWAKVQKSGDDECWLWTGCKRGGYGCFNSKGLPKSAHIVSWIIHKEEDRRGLCVCHSCDNPSCVNPNHLWLGTIKDNVQDCVAKGRHVSPKGSRHGSYTKPEMRARGKRNGVHTKPWTLKRGADNPNAKLNEEIVKIIREKFKQGESACALGRTFSVSDRTIGRIIRNEHWKHVG